MLVCHERAHGYGFGFGNAAHSRTLVAMTAKHAEQEIELPIGTILPLSTDVVSLGATLSGRFIIIQYSDAREKYYNSGCSSGLIHECA